jgi:hypothetical protein
MTSVQAALVVDDVETGLKRSWRKDASYGVFNA